MDRVRGPSPWTESVDRVRGQNPWTDWPDPIYPSMFKIEHRLARIEFIMVSMMIVNLWIEL
jgi:hypothetical protein